jgi:hypothetical protein
MYCNSWDEMVAMMETNLFARLVSMTSYSLTSDDYY